MTSQITAGRLGAARVVALHGDIDLAGAPRVAAVIDETVARGPGAVILDLCDMTSVNSAGLVLLVNALERAVHAGCRVAVVCPPGPVRRMLDLGRAAAPPVDVHDTREAAVRTTQVLTGGSKGAVADVPGGSERGGSERPAAHPADGSKPAPADGAAGLRPATRGRRAGLLADALVVVEQRYAERDLSLAAVARQVATSRRQLQRVFAEVGHSTFRHELTAVRMRHVAELLQTTPLPVKAIADRVGYSQPAQLAKVFRRHYGLAPAAFRRAVAARPLSQSAPEPSSAA